MDSYFAGSVKQHVERGERLLARIPRDLPREFHLLAQTCQRELSSLLDTLRSLLNDHRMLMPEFQPERIRLFRRAVEHMGFLEKIGIAALERHHKDDQFLNRLLERIKNEIAYPLLPPVVTCLSQGYFHIYPGINLLFVPLSEGDFLLHLPDLYHELAHTIINERNDPRVKPFQDALFEAFSVVLEYIREEKAREERGRGPKQFLFFLRLWEESWKRWIIEFFCDLFALCTLGPAFAWGHFHLSAKTTENPFAVPMVTWSSHPANDARLKTMLHALRKMGFGNEVVSIEKYWKNLLAISGSKAESEYPRCFPESILKEIAVRALDGVRLMACQVAAPETRNPVHTTLNTAWIEFWRNPDGYIKWERAEVEKLRGLCS